METLSADSPGREVTGSVALETICHGAWRSGVAALSLRAGGRRSKVRSKPTTARSGTKPPRTAVCPYARLTFSASSVCEVTLHSPLPQPLKPTQSHTHTKRTRPRSLLTQSADRHERMQARTCKCSIFPLDVCARTQNSHKHTCACTHTHTHT